MQDTIAVPTLVCTLVLTKHSCVSCWPRGAAAGAAGPVRQSGKSFLYKSSGAAGRLCGGILMQGWNFFAYREA